MLAQLRAEIVEITLDSRVFELACARGQKLQLRGDIETCTFIGL